MTTFMKMIVSWEWIKTQWKKSLRILKICRTTFRTIRLLAHCPSYLAGNIQRVKHRLSSRKTRWISLSLGILPWKWNKCPFWKLWRSMIGISKSVWSIPTSKTSQEDLCITLWALIDKLVFLRSPITTKWILKIISQNKRFNKEFLETVVR